MRRSTRTTYPAMADLAPLVAVLGAGAGARFGGGKLDAMCAGKPVGAWVLEVVAEAGLAPGVIVVPTVVPHFAQISGWRLIVNDCAADGLGTSLARAAGEALAVDRPLLVLLADMPMISAAYLRDLTSGQDLAGTLYPDGKTGVPALFPRDMLPQLTHLEGDSGAGALLSRNAEVKRLSPGADMLIDVDRAEDLARAEALLLRRE